MKIQMLKTKQGLTPLYNSGYESYQKLKIGWEGEVTFTQKRNYEFHKKFMALVNMAFKNEDKYNNFDHYRSYLTIKAGFYTAYEMDGWTHKEADSISFASMDEIEFGDLYSKMLDVVIKEMGITGEEVDQNILDFM